MAERYYALADIGGTNCRVGVYDNEAGSLGVIDSRTNALDYEGTVLAIAHEVAQIADGRPIAAACVAVAAEVGSTGLLTRSGALSAFLGRNLREDMEEALGLPEGRVGTHNDVVVIAISQQAINRQNRKEINGLANTLSSGWGAARYTKDGQTAGDEPGHQLLRQGAVCPCGEDGHAEAWIAGAGVQANHGMSMHEWLKTDGAPYQLATDISTAWIQMIERHLADGFDPEEFRWTGGMALNQPFIVQSAVKRVREHFGADKSPVFDTVTMGGRAGLHGAFIDAQRRASAY